mgnify:CR=1 FL=1
MCVTAPALACLFFIERITQLRIAGTAQPHPWFVSAGIPLICIPASETMPASKNRTH